MKKSTVEIENDISSMTSITELEEYIRREGIGKLNFGDRLLELCAKYGMKPGELQKSVDISKSLFYAVLSGERNPSKETVIKIALTLGASLEETNELLKLAKHKELYPKLKEDAIIIFGIRNKKDIYEIDELLEKNRADIRLTNKG